ncbi:MAG: TonB-dependent receptor domain-containing protein [bacterium]
MLTKRSIWQFFYTIVFLILTTVRAYSGTTGKIAGKVVDAATKEPLIGVNVIIVGTTSGGATDLDGNYYILNIPPGAYQLKATYIGYSPYVVNNVKVSIDLTTRINFELQEEAVAMAEIIVSAEKPIVQKDLTSTTAKVGGEQISMLPIEDVATVVNLQAGVVNGHFRGGRSNEVKYMIDGVSVVDVFSGNQSIQAEVNAIEEVQVLSGTFNAEYGEALSGVVNQVTKIPDRHYSGELSGYSGDYISDRKSLFKNLDHLAPTDVYNLQGSFSGPVPGLGDLLKFMLSGRYFNDEGYIYGQRVFNPSDSSNFSANDPNEWHIGATGDKEFVPMKFNQRLTLQGKLSIKVGKSRGIVLHGFFQKRDFREYNHLYQLNPDGDYKRFERGLLGSISYTHLFGGSAFLDLLGSAFITKYNQYVFENPLDPRYVNPDRKRDVGGSAFYSGGTENWHFSHKTQTYTAKADLTTQVTNVHQIKSGIEYKLHDLQYKDFQVRVDASTGFKPELPEPGSFDFNTYQNNPYQFAAYIQDKIELDYLIVNLGVRFDYFEPDGQTLNDPDDIAALDELHPPFPDSLFTRASAKYQFSPRVGLSYPISDRGAIHVSYGHFFQIPPFEFLYKNPNFRIPLTGNFPEFVGNTIGNADLDPQKTVVYEIGLQQEIAENLGMTITGYYKDIRNLLSNEIHIKNEFRKFGKYINRDYGAVRGLTFSLERRLRNGFGANIDYTYQVAEGNASDPNDDFNKAQASPPIASNKQLVPLDWDRRHSLNFSVTLGQPRNYIASFIGQLGSGLPYTPSLQNQRTGLENSDNRPAFFNVDLYLTKYLTLNQHNFSIFLKVFNLFDTANEIEVFGDTGRAGYTLELTRAQQAPRGVNTLNEFFTRPDFYSAPRQIVIGVLYSF